MRISWPDLKLYSKNKVLEHHKTNHANYFKLIGSRTELLDFEFFEQLDCFILLKMLNVVYLASSVP